MAKRAKKRRIKAAKKRGVKPGTKRGPYKKSKKRVSVKTWRLLAGGEPLIADAAAAIKSYAEHVSSVAEALPELTLCQQLEEAVTRLENRVSNSIARINSLMGKI